MADRRFRLGIGAYLNLLIGLMFVAAAIVVVLLVRHDLQEQARLEAGRDSASMVDRHLAIHTYFTKDLKPQVMKLSDRLESEDYFEPTWMSSTFAVRKMEQYFKEFASQHSSRAGFYYKECAINARTPANEADEYERAFLKKLGEDPSLMIETVVRKFDGEPYLTTLRRGEIMEPVCLRCHSTPDAAPKGLVDVYGPERSFGRKSGEVASAISTRIPLAEAYAEANEFAWQLSGFLIVLLICLFAGQLLVSRLLLVGPLSRIRKKVTQISDSDHSIDERVPVPASRELAELAEAFNTMSDSVRCSHSELEGRVEERTAELSQSRSFLQTVIDAMPDSVMVIDLDHRVILANRRAKEITGGKDPTTASSYCYAVSHHCQNPCTGDKELCPMEQIVETRKSVTVIHTHYQDDREIFIEVTAAPIFDEAGQVIQIIESCRDVTDRKRAEEDIQELAKFPSENPNPVLRITRDGEVLYSNKAGELLLGAWGSAVGKTVPQKWRHLIAEAFASEKGTEEDEVVKDKIFSITIAPVKESGYANFYARDITDRTQAEEALRRIEWLLTQKPVSDQKHLGDPPYGNLVDLNTNRLLADTIEETTLAEIVDGYLYLLESSAAVYEKNGDYALGLFSSGWCKTLDQASRDLCDTDDNREALACGKWLCHESCWSKCSKIAIETGQPVDIECNGGIHLYAVPILAGDNIVGAINFGYGDPPRDPQKLQEIAEKYSVDVDELIKQADEYKSRPPFIVDLAKRRLIASARLIGATVERKRAADQLRRARDELEQRVQERTAVAEQRAEQLRALALDLSRTEQRERRRLAEVLHDNLQQLLVAAKMNVQTLKRRIWNKQDADKYADQIDDLLSESIKSSRSLTAELSPPILHSAGLDDALEWLGGWMYEKHGLKVDVSADPEANPSSDEICLLVFQSVRELLFNVVKHADVNLARVEMSRNDGHVQVVVSDEGAGFDPEEKTGKKQHTSTFGLFSISERMSLLGGTLAVDSDPGKGTVVTLRVPTRLAKHAGDESGASPRVAEQGATEMILSAAPTKAADKIHVLVADDLQVMRDGLAALLEHESDIDVVGRASNGQQAVELAARTHPDVVIMDVSMPIRDGVEATRKIVAALPNTRVIGLSMHEKEIMASKMLDAGASIYLTKDGPSEELLSAIRNLAAAGRATSDN